MRLLPPRNRGGAADLVGDDPGDRRGAAAGKRHWKRAGRPPRQTEPGFGQRLAATRFLRPLTSWAISVTCRLHLQSEDSSEWVWGMDAVYVHAGQARELLNERVVSRANSSPRHERRNTSGKDREPRRICRRMSPAKAKVGNEYQVLESSKRMLAAVPGT